MNHNHRALVGFQALSVLMDEEVKKLLLNFFTSSYIIPSESIFGLKQQFYKSFIHFFYNFFSVYQQFLPEHDRSKESSGTLGMRSLGLTWSNQGNYRVYLILIIFFECFEIFKQLLLEKKELLLKLLRILSFNKLKKKFSLIYNRNSYNNIIEDIEDYQEEAMLEKIKGIIKKIDKFFQFLKVFNFLYFLYTGQGPTLVHSLARVNMKPLNPSSDGSTGIIPYTSSQLFYESRKIIWYSTIALVTSLSMTIDLEYLKSTSYYLVKTSTNFLIENIPFLDRLVNKNKDIIEGETEEKKLIRVTDLSCGKCGKKPSEMAQVLSPCSHVVCYLCIPSSSLASSTFSSFSCPKCFCNVKSFESWNLDIHCPDNQSLEIE